MERARGDGHITAAGGGGDGMCSTGGRGHREKGVGVFSWPIVHIFAMG